MSVSTNSGAISAAGQGTVSNVHIGTNKGTFVAVKDNNPGSGTITNTTIGTNLGTVSANTISTMSVSSIGAFGTITATGTVSNLSVSVFSGVLIAGTIDSLIAKNAPGNPQMLKVVEGGVTRQLELAPATPGGSLPQSVSYVYDHNPNSNDAQLTLAVNDGANTGSYDVELLSSSAAPGSGFDLAALTNVGAAPAHIRNVLIEGNLAPYTGDYSQIGIPSNVNGVYLPGTALAGVGIMGNAPSGSVTAASIEAVSFASITEDRPAPYDPTRTVTVAATDATPWDAAQLLAPGTAIVQANNTFLAAAGQTGQGLSQPVALFLDTGPNDDDGDAKGHFDPRVVLLGNEGNVIGASNPVLAQTTVTIPNDDDKHGDHDDDDDPSLIQTIHLTGAGGSIQTAQPIAASITSSDALGDLILQAPQGIEANITAPSIFGNIMANGSISGTIQTTTGNLGRVLTSNGHVLGVTTIQASDGISGEIISTGDLVSQVHVNGGFSGVLAAGGNLGYLDPSSLKRVGGLAVNGGFSGDVVVLGNIYGDIFINGGLSGRIAAQGAPNNLGAGRQGILGNININGGMSNTSAIVSAGEIGDAGLGTDLDVNGSVKGILAAIGSISYEIHGSTKFASIFNNVGNPNSPQYDGGANEAAIDAIFSGLTIGDLTALLLHLNKLHVSNGNLSDS